MRIFTDYRGAGGNVRGAFQRGSVNPIIREKGDVMKAKPEDGRKTGGRLVVRSPVHH
jgi:hypothetical protein